MSAQLPPFTDLERRDVNADDTVSTQRVRQPARIQPIGLCRIAGFQSRPKRVDDDHTTDVCSDRVNEVPGRRAGLDRHGCIGRTPSAKRRNAGVRSWKSPLPLPLAAG